MCLDLLDEQLAAAATATPLIIDVGCGTGLMLEHLAERGTPVGVDLSPLALDFCRERGAPRLVRGNGVQLPFPDASVDAITAVGVIEHLDDDIGALAEWRRVLKPGGALVLLTSSYEWMWSGHDVSNHHVRRYTASELRSLLRVSGFDVERLSYVNSVLFPPIAALRVVQRLRRGQRPPAPHKDTGSVPAPVNRMLTGVLELERKTMARRPLPFGVSMVASATAPA